MSAPDNEAQGERESALSRTRTRVVAVWRRLPRAARFLVVLAVCGFTLTMSFALGAYVTLRATITSPEIVVPKVIDMDGHEAREALAAVGLRFEVAGSRHDPNAPAGKVLEQIPEAGSRTKQGRQVRIVQSLGPPEATIPDLTGMTLRTAQLALRSGKLKLRETAAVPHRTTALGRVVGQDPPPGAAGYPGDGVSVVVSAGAGPRAYVMPNLRGIRLAEVSRLMERGGFTRVRERTLSGGATSPSFVVVDQDPAPGRRVTTEDGIMLTAAPSEFGESR